MAHESFESPQVAALLNSRFVSIKVDREERPDLDRIYMGAVQALTGSGGWPMSVFLTPEGHPFYGGTYFPPEPRHGLPGFTHLLSQIADAWSTRREEITRAGNELVDDLLRRSGRLRAASIAGEQALNTAIQHLIETHDDRWGGWGSGPKFPQPMALEFLLRTFRATGDPNVLGIINAALEAMARGGIYDQIGGGFHRYTVDGRWLIPHFEKMLYDNAQLANVYVHAWQVTGRPLYRAVAEETLNYLAREMRLPAGGYASTQDADTEGVEGDTYLWMPAEIQSVLGEDAARFAASYPTTREGNYEGRNILTYSGQEGEREALADRRAALLAHRAQRSQPRRDGKVICSWNGLLLAALAEAGVALGESAYIASAQSLGAFLTEQMRAADGRMVHIWHEGESRPEGYLEDQAATVHGLIALYQATWDERWVATAREIMELSIAHFWDDGWFDTADDHEALIVRPREAQDNATPSGPALATLGLLRLARYYEDDRYARMAESELATMRGAAARFPEAFAQWLSALDLAHRPRVDVAIGGTPAGAEAQALLNVLNDSAPERLVAIGMEAALPILAGRTPVAGHAAAYVCLGQRCLPPVTTPLALAQILDRDREGAQRGDTETGDQYVTEEQSSDHPCGG